MSNVAILITRCLIASFKEQLFRTRDRNWTNLCEIISAQRLLISWRHSDAAARFSRWSFTVKLVTSDRDGHDAFVRHLSSLRRAAKRHVALFIRTRARALFHIAVGTCAEIRVTNFDSEASHAQNFPGYVTNTIGFTSVSHNGSSCIWIEAKSCVFNETD